MVGESNFPHLVYHTNLRYDKNVVSSDFTAPCKLLSDKDVLELRFDLETLQELFVMFAILCFC